MMEVTEFVRREGAKRDLSDVAVNAIAQSLEQLAASHTRPAALQSPPCPGDVVMMLACRCATAIASLGTIIWWL